MGGERWEELFSNFSHPTSNLLIKNEVDPSPSFTDITRLIAKVKIIKSANKLIVVFVKLELGAGPKPKSEFNGGSNKNFHQKEFVLVSYIKFRNKIRPFGGFCF